jgi:hypothetical protein
MGRPRERLRNRQAPVEPRREPRTSDTAVILKGNEAQEGPDRAGSRQRRPARIEPTDGARPRGRVAASSCAQADEGEEQRRGGNGHGDMERLCGGERSSRGVKRGVGKTTEGLTRDTVEYGRSSRGRPGSETRRTSWPEAGCNKPATGSRLNPSRW